MVALLALSLLQAMLPAPAPVVRAWVRDVAIATRAEVVAVAATDGALYALDAENGATTARWQSSRAAAAERAAFVPWRVAVAPTGSPIAVLTFDHRVFLWTPAAESAEARAPRLVATVPGTPDRPEGGWGFGAFLAFSSTGERLLTGAGEGGAVLLDAEGETVAKLSSLGGSWFFAPLAWSADGTRFAAADGSVARVFDARTGEPLDVQVPPSTETVKCVALTANGARLAVGTNEGHVREFDLATGALRWESELVDPWLGPGGGTRVGALGYSPDGAWLAATSAAGIYGALYDAATGRQHWMGNDRGGRMGEPADIAWGPDSRSWTLAYVSGVMPIGRVRVGAEVTEETLLDGSLPELGPRGLAVTVAEGEVVAFTAEPSRPAWTFRP